MCALPPSAGASVCASEVVRVGRVRFVSMVPSVCVRAVQCECVRVRVQRVCAVWCVCVCLLLGNGLGKAAHQKSIRLHREHVPVTVS